MKRLIFLILFVLFLGACTTGGNAPVTEDEATGSEEATAGAIEVSPMTTETPKPTPPDPTAITPPGAVVPVTVDLSQLTPPGTAVATTPQVIPAPGIPDPLVALVSQVSQDLAQRLTIDVSQVTLVEAIAVDWSDSSLGCPQPGMSYLMVITPGYQITLVAQGEEYTYHTDQGRYFVLCGADGRPLPG
ncbi:MAG: hypothetical protein KJ069_08745 [Anaerolineae bacterium]|nr:hypothetical protein [Anaerolineae bacterium]